MTIFTIMVCLIGSPNDCAHSSRPIEEVVKSQAQCDAVATKYITEFNKLYPKWEVKGYQCATPKDAPA